MRKEYTTVSLPKEIMNKMDQKIEGMGYSSRAEFIKASIRRELSRLKK